MKTIGFLSFGHWSDSYGSRVRSAADSLLQSIELAVAAEELGADGADFRVQHFARQRRFRCSPPSAQDARHLRPLVRGYNAHVIESVLKYVAPELGWR